MFGLGAVGALYLAASQGIATLTQNLFRKKREEHEERVEEKRKNMNKDLAEFNHDKVKDIEQKRHENSLELFKLQKELKIEEVKITILEKAKDREWQKKLQEDSFNFQGFLEEIRYEHNQVLQQENFRFQKELQDFIQSVQIAINNKNLDFQRWRFEQEKKIQYDLEMKRAEVQREIAYIQQETALKSIERKAQIDASPIHITVYNALKKISKEHQPLYVFAVPAKLKYEMSSSATQQTQEWPEMETSLNAMLLKLRKLYNDNKRPLEIIDGAWRSKVFNGTTATQTLFSELENFTVLILESTLNKTDEKMHLRLDYWEDNWQEPHTELPIPDISYHNILYEFAKRSAQSWHEYKDTRIKAGKKIEFLSEKEKKDEANLQKLQVEREDEALGLKRTMEYDIDKSHYADFYKILNFYYCLIIGLMADNYFLSKYHLPPLLPKLFPDILAELGSLTEFHHEILNDVVAFYIQAYESICENLTHWKPELLLDLANSFLNLPNKTFSNKIIEKSMKSWLALHDISNKNKNNDVFTVMLPELSSDDYDYVKKLQQVLSLTPDTTSNLQADKLSEILNEFAMANLTKRISRDYQGDTLY